MFSRKNDRSFEPLYSFNRRKTQALMDAVDREDHERIRALFTKRKFEYDGEARKDRVDNVLVPQYAYRNGKIDALMTMLQCGVDPGDHPYYMGISLVEDLILEGNLELLERVLPYVKEPDCSHIFEYGDKQIKTTYFGLCAYLGKISEAEMLMKAGALPGPRSTKEALELNADCAGTYDGSFNIRLRDGRSGARYYRVWKKQNLEPWQFSLLCGDKEATYWFLKQGRSEITSGLKELVLQIREKDILELLQREYPELMSEVFKNNNAAEIIAAGNAELLKSVDLRDADVTLLGRNCGDESELLHCYDVLKARLPRELTMEEKCHLVKLMLQYRSIPMVEICEKEWATESGPCDISEWAVLIPKTGPGEKEFVKVLTKSKLRLVIRPEHPVFDEMNHYFDPDTGVYQNLRCFDHMRNLTVFERVVDVLPPQESEEFLPFTKRILQIGKKGAFDRLVKWGLICEANLPAVSEYILEKGLDQYYDQTIAKGENRGNQKTYDL